MTGTILCVDDDRDFCKILHKALSGEGYEVQLAHDGEKALEWLSANSPDLILMDVMLPKRDGFETLEAIRSLGTPEAEVPVLMTSACRVTPQYRTRAAKLGAAAMLVKPVPLAALLREVSSQLKPRVPAVSSRSVRSRKRSRVAARRADRPLAGSLEDLSFPHLLHHLHGLRASGVLHLTSGRKRKALQLRDGYPSSVSSNLVTECLGNLLMRRGLLDRKSFDESVKRVKKGEGLQGQILVAMELMTEEDIAAALREQAEEKLLEVFGWKRGTFKFELEKRLKRGNALALDGSPANLILQGTRQRFPIDRIEAFLRQNAGHFVARGESPFYRFQEIDLSPTEARLLASLEEGRNLIEFRETDESVKRSLYALIVTGMLHLHVGLPSPPAPRRSETTAEPLPRPERRAPDAEAQRDRELRSGLAAMAERLRGQGYYEMFGLPEYADEGQIQTAYEALLRRVHPDRFKSASGAVRKIADEVCELISKAHQTLGDPRRRKTYLRRLREGKKEAAHQEEGRRALEAEIEFEKGDLCLRQRDYEQALEHFGTALKLYSNEGEYHAHYGWCLHLCHPDDSVMVQEAIEHVKRGVRLARDHAKPYLYLGRLYKAIGRSDAAEKMFTRAVEIRSDCMDALRELRLINVRRQKKSGVMGKLLRRRS
ncbi:MAG: response regulator [Myxococcota bacterium]